MEYIIEKIKDYVLVVNPTIDRNDFLDFVVRDVVDRAIVYMNRYYLVKYYNDDSSVPGFDVADYDEQYRPIPTPLWRSLASTVINVYKQVEAQQSSTSGTTPDVAIKRIRDNGQEVEYTEKIASFLSSASDSEVFGSIITQLDNYRLAKVIGDEYTKYIYRQDFTGFLR